MTLCISPAKTPASKYVSKLSYRPELSRHLHIYPAPQHVDSGVSSRSLSQTILIYLEGKLCEILQTNFGECAFRALG